MSKQLDKKKTSKATIKTANNCNDSIEKYTEQTSLTITQCLSFKTNKPRKYIPHTIVCNKHELPTYRIHMIERFLLPHECEYFINWSENRGFEECKQTQTKEYAHRENGRIQIEDPDLALQIFGRLQPLIPHNVDGLKPRGCSSNVRFYRYTAGQRFGKHIDESHHGDSLAGVTKYTLLIYLNGAPVPEAGISSAGELALAGADGGVPATVSDNLVAAAADASCAELSPHCTGGQTVFYKGHKDQDILLEVSPQQGMCLLHGHGSKCLTHEGREVTSGAKYVLRTDVVYG